MNPLLRKLLTLAALLLGIATNAVLTLIEKKTDKSEQTDEPAAEPVQQDTTNE